MTHCFPSGEGLKAQYVMSAMRGLSIKAKHNREVAWDHGNSWLHCQTTTLSDEKSSHLTQAASSQTSKRFKAEVTLKQVDLELINDILTECFYLNRCSFLAVSRYSTRLGKS